MLRHIPFTIALIILSLVHPAFANNIKTIEGKELAHFVSKNKGKVIFITTFATWCPACKQEMPHIVSISKKYANKPVIFIGISIDNDKQLLVNYIKEAKITFPLYLAGPTIAPMFRIAAIPHNIIYNRKGELVYNAAGILSEGELSSMLNKHLK